MFEIGSWYYFVFFLAFIGLTLGLHFGFKFLIKKKFVFGKLDTLLFVKLILFSFLIFAVLTDLFIGPLLIKHYEIFSVKWQNEMFRTNMCAVSVVLFPFCFWSKQKFFKNIIIFVGIISGVAAVIYPDEILGDPVDLKVFKFYWQHIIICMVPILMLSLNIYKVNFKDIAWIPLMFTMYQMIVIFNQAVQFKLGFLKDYPIDYTNRALQWGTDEFSVLFDWLTPTFMRPLPIFSTIIPLHFFMWIFSALIVLIYKLSKKELHFSDIRKIKNIRFSTFFKKKQKKAEVNVVSQSVPSEAKPESKDTEITK